MKKKMLLSLFIILIILLLCSCTEKGKIEIKKDTFGIDLTDCLDKEMTSVLESLNAIGLTMNIDDNNSNQTLKQYYGIEQINGIDYDVSLTFLKYDDNQFKLGFYHKSHNFKNWPTETEIEALEEVFHLWLNKYGEPTYADEIVISEQIVDNDGLVVQWKKSQYAFRRAEMHLIDDDIIHVFFYDCSVEAMDIIATTK